MRGDFRGEGSPAHYLRIVGNGCGSQVWRIDEDEAVMLGVSKPETEPEAFYRRGARRFANGRSQKKRLGTKECLALRRIMRLEQYAVGFRRFPWLAPIRPFEGWVCQNPTGSLEWYDAYNRVKHDREGSFNLALLEQAFSAVTACIIMLAAQYTPSIGLGGRSDLNAFFQFVETPKWDPEESYASLLGGHDRRWTIVRHPALVHAE